MKREPLPFDRRIRPSIRVWDVVSAILALVGLLAVVSFFLWAVWQPWW